MIRRTEYELMLIAHPDLDRDEGVPALIAKVNGWIEGVDGEVTYSDIWGRRRLAYKVRKHGEGTYILIRAIIPRESILDLERDLKLEEEIIRYLITRAETPLPPRPQPRPRPSPAEEIPAQPVEVATEQEAALEPEIEDEVEVEASAADELLEATEAETADEETEEEAPQAEPEPETDAGTENDSEDELPDAAEKDSDAEEEAD